MENEIFIKKELREYLFIRGFLLTNKKDINLELFPFYNNWEKIELNYGYAIYKHKKTNISVYEKDSSYFFILGHAYNPFTGEIDEKIILKRIAENYSTINKQDYIDELTGVFVFGVLDKDKIEYQVDPSGMQSACYGYIGDSFYLSSHSQLIGDICNLQMSKIAKRYVGYKWYYRVMGPYLPADLTQFDNVKRIVPDIEYTYSNGEINHKRFYPIKDIKTCENEQEYNETIIASADILKKNMELVAKKWKKPYISLTGGIDSNTTFASANGIYDKFKAFSYISAEKETIDADAAKKIADKFNVERLLFNIPNNNDELQDFDEFKKIIDHNNGYIANGKDNEYRKRIYLLNNLDCDVEVKSWVSETIRAYWYKHYGRSKMPKLSPRLFRNLYKIFIFNRPLAWKTDRIFKKYINDFEYRNIPSSYLPADMHYNEVTWGSWGGLNISEMKIYSDITFIYNNRKFLDLLFKVPLEKRISDEHHLDMKKYLNKELYDMNIRVVNMMETDRRAKLLNIIFTVNSHLPF